MDSGKVRICGKEYKTVALRVNEFRADEKYHDFSIETDLISNANLVVMKAIIKNRQGHIVATGYAEEERDSTNINRTSALENCETSAIGRALACLGLAGTEYASANEVSEAIINQAKKDVSDYFVKYNATVNRNIDFIYGFKSCVADNDPEGAAAQWFDISKDERRYLSKLAPTKGGVLTTEERKFIDDNQVLFADPDIAEQSREN